MLIALSPGDRPRGTRRLVRPALTALLLVAVARPASANNLNESLAWQFKSANDIAAQAALRELIERRRSGAYSAPDYTTNIARQYVCSVTAAATGNSGTQSALANSPSVTGASAQATGNSNGAAIDGSRSGATIGNDQANNGAVGSSIVGSTSSTVTGAAWQALNSDQANSGNQSASVQGSSACAFGALN